MSETKNERPIAQIVVELENANERLRNADIEVSVARNRATDALNNVNRLQRELEAAFAKMAKAAPGGTDWHRAQHKGSPE